MSLYYIFSQNSRKIGETLEWYIESSRSKRELFLLCINDDFTGPYKPFLLQITIIEHSNVITEIIKFEDWYPEFKKLLILK